MNIISFCKTKPSKKDIDEAISFEWWSQDLNCFYFEDNVLNEFKKEFRGIDVNALSQYKPAQKGDRRIILVEESFDNGMSMFEREGSLILSTSNMPKSQNTLLIQISLIIYRWKHCVGATCDNDCLFNIKTKEIKFSLCNNCEDYLSDKQLFHDIVSCNILLSIINNNYPFDEKIYSVNIFEYAKPKNIILRSSYLQTKYAELIIDFQQKAGSEARNWLKSNSEIILKSIEEKKDKYTPYRNNLPKIPFCIASRRWNSWTPNQPNTKTKTISKSEKRINPHHKKGGGYFISDGETNIVVDPGYGFIDMIYEFHNITVMDIDAIVITHDHPDHSSELQNILTLRYIYESSCENKLKIFMNLSSYFIHERIIMYHNRMLESGYPYLIIPSYDTVIRIGEIELSSIEMFHKEIYDSLDNSLRAQIIEYFKTKVPNDRFNNLCKSGALGLKFTGKDFSISIPGDTSFPNNKEDIERIGAFFHKPDIVSLHIGSLEKSWKIESEASGSSIKYGDDKHLGLNGIIKFISLLQPKVVIISEFGEELNNNDYRLAIIELIKELSLRNDVIIIPSDFNLFLTIKGDDIFFKCKQCGDYVPLKHVSLSKDRDDFLEYHFSAGCKSGLKHFKISELERK